MDEEGFVKTLDSPGRQWDVTARLPVQDLRLSSDTVLLTGILIVAAGLRFVALGHNSIWLDEAVVANVARARWQDILPLLRAEDAHPPLYYLLMKAWASVAGTGEAALRLPSACFSLASVALTYALMRRLSSGPVSLLSALLVSTAPFAIMSGQEARMYPLLGMLALAATLVLLVGVEQDQWWQWVMYTTAATLAIYTHYLGLFVLAAHGGWVIRYERRRLGRWLTTMAVAAAFYAPWVPSLVYQAAHAHAWFLSPLYGDKPPFLKLGDLLGLFAFGGSLFRMPSYFLSGTPLTPFEQLVVFLPFLAVLGSGIASLSRDGRALALLGLPPAIAVGGMQLVALVSPAFIARWFSYLLPFYAMVTAEGVFALARAIHGRLDRTVAVITAGLLLYNLAVLNRYYLDPAFRPYQWRSAAALVEQKFMPSDALLYGDPGNKAAFTYYFRKRVLSMTLLPRPDFAAIQQLPAGYRRVWLIVAPPFSDAMLQQTLSALRTSFVFVAGSRMNGTGVYPWVYLFETKPPAQR